MSGGEAQLRKGPFGDSLRDQSSYCPVAGLLAQRTCMHPIQGLYLVRADWKSVCLPQYHPSAIARRALRIELIPIDLNFLSKAGWQRPSRIFGQNAPILKFTGI